MHESTTSQTVLPGQTLQTDKMPGHWLLARLGKRVLRPGGIELTQRMLEALHIHSGDHIVEFAPGLGLTAKLVLQRRPATYTAIERDEAAAKLVRRYLSGRQQRCLVGNAEQTGLPAESVTVVYGEAMLTMQTPETKARIMQEAWRILESGGRYGFHELCLVPDTLDEGTKKEIALALLQAIHVGARPLTVSE
jgi:ubiquinone/menaquinone biosynthesis C-methylase UbiE